MTTSEGYLSGNKMSLRTIVMNKQIGLFKWNIYLSVYTNDLPFSPNKILCIHLPSPRRITGIPYSLIMNHDDSSWGLGKTARPWVESLQIHVHLSLFAAILIGVSSYIYIVMFFFFSLLFFSQRRGLNVKSLSKAMQNTRTTKLLSGVYYSIDIKYFYIYFCWLQVFLLLKLIFCHTGLPSFLTIVRIKSLSWPLTFHFRCLIQYVISINFKLGRSEDARDRYKFQKF